MTSTDAVWNDHAPALYRKACFQIRVQLVASIAMPVTKGLCQVGARPDAGGNEPRCKIGVATQAETDQSYQGRTARRKLIRSFAGPGQQQRPAEALATGNRFLFWKLVFCSLFHAWCLLRAWRYRAHPPSAQTLAARTGPRFLVLMHIVCCVLQCQRKVRCPRMRPADSRIAGSCVTSQHCTMYCFPPKCKRHRSHPKRKVASEMYHSIVRIRNGRGHLGSEYSLP